jgi:hypothetical protein
MIPEQSECLHETNAFLALSFSDVFIIGFLVVGKGFLTSSDT